MKISGTPIGQESPFFLIAGPCVIESEQLALQTADKLDKITKALNIPFIYKSSYDKANRTSGDSPRGPGLDQGLEILAKVRASIGVPILTDVHTVTEVRAAAQAVDFIQTPAFLCRQTDLIVAAAKCGKPVNIKKGQFLSPQEMVHVIAKAKTAHRDAQIMVCERGTSFGYNNLVVDMRALSILNTADCPVVFDATHSVQLPGGAGDCSSGQREFVPALARAAVAVGIAGLFIETHPDPDHAWSDGANAWPLDKMAKLLSTLQAIDHVRKQLG